MINPLLSKFNTPFETPPFGLIQSEHYLPALKTAIEEAKTEIKAIRDNSDAPNFENTIAALEFSGERVGLIAEIFFNINEANTGPELQSIAQAFSPILSEYSNDILLDEALFKRVASVWQTRDSLNLDKEERKLLEKTYKSFVRNGALLNAEQKIRLREIDIDLGKKSLSFGEHVLEETNKYKLVIENEEDLKGIPPHAIEAAAETAKENHMDGKWVFTLQFPSYLPLVTYSAKRELRKEMAIAYGSRSSKGDALDNRELVKEIVALRHERARLLGYENHAHFILEERMAESPEKVMDFLLDLLSKAKPAGERDIQTLENYARELGEALPIARWDIAYLSEKLKMERFQIDDELLKPYFKLENVLNGVFEIARRLYGIVFIEDESIPKYHSDVKTFRVESQDTGRHMAVFYADFFPRKSKRNGAWMTTFRGQSIKQGVERRPHVSIVCNFTKPSATRPSLLTFNEVTTLFHEFGHALHSILAEGKFGSLTGTHVYWDFVELPSQIMENWAYEKECLDLFARHYETGESIPMEWVEKIKQSSNFMEGYQTIRQLSFGLLDMAWHYGDGAGDRCIEEFEQDVLSATDLLPAIPGTTNSCAFSHIFQGGYSAGYYSYKWAEVLDADAFAYFKQKGIFDIEVATKFKEHILSAGGTEHPMELYKKFRGQEPNVEALLERAGLVG